MNSIMIRYCHKSCGLAIRINPITILNYVEKLRFEGNLEQQQQQQNRLIALISLLIMYEHEIFIIFVCWLIKITFFIIIGK